MLTYERHNLIVKLLNKNKNIKLIDVIAEFKISEATARRDLIELEKKGVLLRVHGGAVIPNFKEHDMPTKGKMNVEHKKRIAKKASLYINNGDTIFLDAGTSVGYLIKYLKDKNVTVITNGISHIPELLSLNISTYLIGGKIKTLTSAIVGFDAVESLKRYNFSKAFIGANSKNEKGYSTPDHEEAIIKKTAVTHATSVYFLCDTSKHNTDSLINFASLEDGILIDES